MIKYNLKELNRQAKEEKIRKAGLSLKNPIQKPQQTKVFKVEEPKLEK